jgi:hypothetical protein
LYEQYCKHRNRDTGRCDPGLKLLARDLNRTYTHVSDMKRELIIKGWIRREGRHAVRLLVGVFPPPKVRPLAAPSSEKSEDEVRKNPNLGNQSSEKSEDEVRKNPNLAPGSPYTDEPVVDEPVAAAAGAADEQAWKKETADARYVESLKTAQLYPKELVEWVWRKLQFRCLQEQVAPTKGRLMYWLSTEREAPPVQPMLPTMGAPVVEGSFNSTPRVRAPDPDCPLCKGGLLLREDDCPCTLCPFCSGTGMEMVEGKARKCRCRQPQSERAPTSEEEIADLERRVREAQEEMRQAGGTG